jgi:hypothetical protein
VSEDERLLLRLRGKWNERTQGVWPTVDAMDEAAGVIERLRARVAELEQENAHVHKSLSESAVIAVDAMNKARADEREKIVKTLKIYLAAVEKLQRSLSGHPTIDAGRLGQSAWDLKNVIAEIES